MRVRQDRIDERQLFQVSDRDNQTEAGDQAEKLKRPRVLAPQSRPLPGIAKKLRRRRDFRAILRQALETETDFATPFLFVPVLLAIGAILYFTASAEPDWSALLAGSAILAPIAYLVRARPVAGPLLLAAFLILGGALAGKIETWRAGTKMLGSAVSTELTGLITALEHQPGGKTRVTMDVLASKRPHLKYAPDRVRIVGRNLPEALKPGMVLRGRMQLMPHSGPVRPSGFDFAFHNYFRRLGAIGFFLGKPKIITESDPATSSRPAILLEQSRVWLTERIKQRIGGQEGEIAAALITGAKSGIPDEVNEALRRTGLAHILSISGLHMALVAGTVIAVFRFAFALFPGFASQHPVRKYAATAALATAFLYLFVSGSGIATQRSFLMLAVMLIALLLDRPAITMRNLAIAAAIIIVLQPHEVVGPSFQMSFAATAALIAVYRAWSRWRDRRHLAAGGHNLEQRGVFAQNAQKILTFATALAVTSIVAGVATTFFGVWHFHRLAPLGLFANLAAMPIVSFIVMPSAVTAMALVPFDLDGPAFAFMGWGIGLVVAIAEWFSNRTPIDTVGMIPAASLLMASAGLTLITLPASWLRWTGLPLFIAALVLAFTRPLPNLLIDENAKMVAILRADGELAISRARPRTFTLNIWKRAAAASGFLKPLKADDPLSAMAEIGGAGTVFACGGDLCMARLENGAVVAHAKSITAAKKACHVAALIVIADATGPADPCVRAQAAVSSQAQNSIVLTARDLAKRGAAAITISQIDPPGQTPARKTASIHAPTGQTTAIHTPPSGETAHTRPANAHARAMDKNVLPAAGSKPLSADHRPQTGYAVAVTYAVTMPWRPWHTQRAFSREARGLPPNIRQSTRRKSQAAPQ